MTTSIYLSNNIVQIVCGDAGRRNVRIEKIYSLTIPEGSLLNGVITSEYNLKNDLKHIWEEYKLPRKGVYLVLDSSQILVKSFPIQKGNRKKMLHAVEAGFADTIQTGGYLFDGCILEGGAQKKQAEALAVAAEADYIHDYVNLFKEIGVALEGIDVSINAQMKVLERIPQMKQETAITSQMDGNNLVSTLIVNGSYVYFNRTRIFSEHSTEGFAAEVGRTISSIMQFYSSQKYEEPLERVYMGGYTEADFEICRPAVESLGVSAAIPDNSPAFVLPGAESAVIESTLKGEPIRTCDYIYPIGALIHKKEDINLYNKHEKGSKRSGSAVDIKKLIPILVVFGVCAVVSAGLLVSNHLTEKNAEDAEAYISNPQNVEAYNEALENQTKAGSMRNSVEEGKEVWKVIQSYPLPNTTVEREILNCAGADVSITVNSYDSATGIYEFTAMSANVTTINEFIARLRESAVFANLEYSGYSMDEKSGSYLIMVSGFLAESAGK